MSNTLDSRPESLKKEQPVFLLGYHDHAMKLPFVEAYVFIGSRADQDEPQRWYFQRASSHLRRPIADVDDAVGDDVLSVDEEGLGTLVDWVGLVAELADRLEDQRRR